MLNANGIDHLNMYVNNLEESISFYQKVFGFKVYEKGRGFSAAYPYAIIGKSKVLMLALYENHEAGSEKRLNHIGINITNFEEALEVIKDNSVEISIYGDKEIIEYPNSKSIYIKDPDGNEIELSSNFAGGL